MSNKTVEGRAEIGEVGRNREFSTVCRYPFAVDHVGISNIEQGTRNVE